MTKLTSMCNIGKEMERKLTAVGIDSAEALASVGAKEAYLRLKAVYPHMCLVHLYTLQSAILGLPIVDLPQDVRTELKDFNNMDANG